MDQAKIKKRKWFFTSKIKERNWQYNSWSWNPKRDPNAKKKQYQADGFNPWNQTARTDLDSQCLYSKSPKTITQKSMIAFI